MVSADPRGDTLALLGLMRLPRVGTVAIHRLLATLTESDTAVRYLLEYDATSLVAEGVLREEQAAMFVSEEEREWRAAMLDELERRNIALLPVTSATYPRGLRAKPRTMQPPLLMVHGRADLLDLGGIAFAGARASSEHGLELARALVAEAVAREFTVISGGAAGTDMTTHEEALARGGSTIVVLAEGIGAPRVQRFDALLESGRAALVSTFLPHEPWQAWRAMDRNRTILGLSDRLVVIEASSRGGTLAAGQDALDAGIPTWVLDTPDPPATAASNRSLLDCGAQPIPVSERGEITVPTELFAIDGWIVTPVGG